MDGIFNIAKGTMDPRVEFFGFFECFNNSKLNIARFGFIQPARDAR